MKKIILILISTLMVAGIILSLVCVGAEDITIKLKNQLAEKSVSVSEISLKNKSLTINILSNTQTERLESEDVLALFYAEKFSRESKGNLINDVYINIYSGEKNLYSCGFHDLLNQEANKAKNNDVYTGEKCKEILASDLKDFSCIKSSDTSSVDANLTVKVDLKTEDFKAVSEIISTTFNSLYLTKNDCKSTVIVVCYEDEILGLSAYDNNEKSYWSWLCEDADALDMQHNFFH